jgi:bis(5'-nucleosyl)-tetraphosphatase (symmetrical)
MATYFIGDIQGCFDEFMLLLNKVNFNHHCDRLYLTGDLIGRGPDSLATLEYVTQHQDSIKTVLGNHDLHFLAISCGIKQAKPSDKFEQLLASPKLAYFVDYLRHQPLLIELPDEQLIVTHAGLSPQWDLATLTSAACAVETQLRQPDFSQLLSQMYCNEPNNWLDSSSKLQRSIYAINALTRMRYCYQDGSLDFSQKCPPAQLEDSRLRPWFEIDNASLDQVRIIFGHWASLLGVTTHPNAIALDTGCLWGYHLSAWCLESQQLVQQKSHRLLT